MNTVEIGKRIGNHRRQQGLKQQQLADSVGRDRSWVSHLERGQIRLSAAMLRKVAAALNLDSAQLDDGSLCREAPVAWRQQRKSALRRFSECMSEDGLWPSLPCSSRKLANTPSGQDSIRVEWDNDSVSLVPGMHLPSAAAVNIAAAMLKLGAEQTRISPAQVGFPIPLLSNRGASVSHFWQICLVRSSRSGALVMFGAERYGWPAYLPPVLALANSMGCRFWLIDSGRGAVKQSSETAQLEQRYWRRGGACRSALAMPAGSRSRQASMASTAKSELEALGNCGMASFYRYADKVGVQRLASAQWAPEEAFEYVRRLLG